MFTYLTEQVGNDWFLLANDFAGYLAAQEEVDATYKDQAEWLRRWVGGQEQGGCLACWADCWGVHGVHVWDCVFKWLAPAA